MATSRRGGRVGACPDRIRTGLAAQHVTKRRNALDLDRVLAVDWLRALFGPPVYERI